MAKVSFLLQAINKLNHADVLKTILSKQLDLVLISVAFARTQGVNAITDALKLNAKNSKVFIGIRNDITSFQAVEMLFDTGASVYGVDTGSKSTIFHPKMYLAQDKKQADVIIGSANLTFGGLHNNIESSSILTLDLDDSNDSEFFNTVVSQFETIITAHPDHIIPISSKKVIKELFESGRLSDEAVVIIKQGSSKKTSQESVSKMKLFHAKPVSIIKKKKGKLFVDEILTNQDGKETIEESTSLAAPANNEFYVVWQSNELSERDLNVPSGQNTALTGSMNWSKGAMENIDQRHHFRNNVFADVDWKIDPKLPHYERAIVKFKIYVKGEFQGEYMLKVSHNNDINSKTYKQSNSMSKVSWGDAKSVIAKKELLGRVLLLSRKDSSPPEFMISID